MVKHMFVRLACTIVLTQDALHLLLVMSLSAFLIKPSSNSGSTLKRKSKLNV